jgi:hypothetical protein
VNHQIEGEAERAARAGAGAAAWHAARVRLRRGGAARLSRARRGEQDGRDSVSLRRRTAEALRELWRLV